MQNPYDSEYPHNTEYEAFRVALKSFFAKRAFDPNAIDDLVQSVYVRLILYTKDGRMRYPAGYIFKVAHNVLNDANRRVHDDREHLIWCDPQTLERYADERGMEFCVPDSSARVSERSELIRAFRKLPRTAQEAYLHQRDGLTYRQIGKKMAVSEHAVKKYISTALQGIRGHFIRQRSSKHRGSPK